MKPYSPHQKTFARQLRSQMTDAEQKLWYYLRRKQMLGLQFYRQKPVAAFIVDFYCPAAKLVIELDGSQHQEEAQHAKDQARDSALSTQDLMVLRFDDRQVLLETEAVLQAIWLVIRDRTASPFAKGG